MDINSITKFISENILILAPVLYILGIILKNLEYIKDKYIPLILLVISFAFTIAMIGVSADAFIQGILVTGATVLANNLIKQMGKED